MYCWKIVDYSLDSVASMMESNVSQIFLLLAGYSHSFTIILSGCHSRSLSIITAFEKY